MTLLLQLLLLIPHRGREGIRGSIGGELGGVRLPPVVGMAVGRRDTVRRRRRHARPGILRERTLASAAGCRGRHRLESVPARDDAVVAMPMAAVGVEVHEGRIRRRSVHDPEGVFPQRPARALREEDVDARLALAVDRAGGDGHGGGRVDAATATAAGGGAPALLVEILRLVNAAVVQDILEGVMMLGAALRGVGGLDDVAPAVTVAVEVVRETASTIDRVEREVETMSKNRFEI